MNNYTHKFWDASVQKENANFMVPTSQTFNINMAHIMAPVEPELFLH